MALIFRLTVQWVMAQNVECKSLFAGTMMLVTVIVVVTVVALRHIRAAHPECTSDLSTRQLWACCRACQQARSCSSICSRF